MLYLLNTALYNHIFSSIFVHMEVIFLFQNHNKHQMLRCLKLYPYFHLRFFFCICSSILLMQILIRGLLHLYKIKTFSLHFHPDFKFRGNLIYYLLTGKLLFPLPGNLFPLSGNLNYYLLPGKYLFSTSGELISTPVKSQLIPSIR